MTSDMKTAGINRDKYKKFELAWLKEYYQGLVGWTCTGRAVVRDFEGNYWPVLKFEKKGHKSMLVDVSRDEEGNGPGYLSGLPEPNLEKP